MPDLASDGPRGLTCPACGDDLRTRMVAKSYPSPGGQYRSRYCRCGVNVETIEAVVGRETNFLDVSDLPRADVAQIRAMLRRFRASHPTT